MKISRRKFLGKTGLVSGSLLLGGGAKAAKDEKIVRAAIHPGIGIARVGNSPEGFFIGPEVVEPELTRAGASRDALGALKRQAARFRIYGYNENDEVVRELTAADARIEWTVHLANKKAAWYRFLAPLDRQPESKDMAVPLRNPTVSDRSSLVIDPGPRSISGKSRSGQRYKFDGGKFMGVPVDLGELRTDTEGRLLVLGGFGKAASPQNKPVFFDDNWDTFNNADGWYDDISDGPVEAKVVLDGEEIPVDSAWVAVAPPNYAPDIIGWRTLYDLLYDTYVAAGVWSAPRETSFTRDVLPALRRLTNLQWVNKGFHLRFGAGSEWDFDNAETIALLADKTARSSDPRGRTLLAGVKKKLDIYESFRLPKPGGSFIKNGHLWPMLYGDAYGSAEHGNYKDSPHTDLVVSDQRARHLKNWLEGDYVNDWHPSSEKVYRKISQVPLQEQPQMLDRAALHFCLSDAFHPGCELTWPMRNISMYRAPFEDRQKRPRFRIKTEGVRAELTEKFLTPELVVRENGPLCAQGPGDLTRWMAVPWQGDTIFCRSGYEPEFDPYLPAYWPARVPNQVLTEDVYHYLMNNLDKPEDELKRIFAVRKHWWRDMKALDPNRMIEDTILQTVRRFDELGVVEARPGPRNHPFLPGVLLVESLPPKVAGPMSEGPGTESETRSGGARTKSKPDPLKEETDPVKQAGWESLEELEEFRRIKRLRKR